MKGDQRELEGSRARQIRSEEAVPAQDEKDLAPMAHVEAPGSTRNLF